MSAYKRNSRLWIMFENVTNLRVDGGGTINGNGRKWWQNSCKINEKLVCYSFIFFLVLNIMKITCYCSHSFLYQSLKAKKQKDFV